MGSELPHEWDKNIQLYYIEVKFFLKNLKPTHSRSPQNRYGTETSIIWV